MSSGPLQVVNLTLNNNQDTWEAEIAVICISARCTGTFEIFVVVLRG